MAERYRVSRPDDPRERAARGEPAGAGAASADPLPDAVAALVEGAVAAPAHDLADVRIHTGAEADAAAGALGAAAWTVGRHVGFAAGAYRPGTAAGEGLLRHELAHARQPAEPGPPVVFRSDSTSGARYTEEQRADMAAGRITGQADDLELATRFGFREGDIVFRLGSKELAQRIGDPVTHGGIYLGGGLIHDMVGFGNRDVRVSDFYAEAADPDVVKVIRFTGPQADVIVPRVVTNIRSRDLDLPTDAVPWNLFSSADDYRTATCLEYSHAQFLYAIRQIALEHVWAPDVLDEIRRTYFRDGSDTPEALIQPRDLVVEGPMGVAINERRLLMAAADYLAEDVDPTVFQNRWEGREELRQIAPVVPSMPSGGFFGGSPPLASFWQREILSAFTYRSFADATRFFTVVR